MVYRVIVGAVEDSSSGIAMSGDASRGLFVRWDECIAPRRRLASWWLFCVVDARPRCIVFPDDATFCK